MELQDKLYTSTQVADILGVSLRTLYRYMEDNKIQSMRTASGRHRFTKDQIMDFLNAGGMGGTSAETQPGVAQQSNTQDSSASIPPQQDQSFTNQPAQSYQPVNPVSPVGDQYNTQPSAQFGQTTSTSPQAHPEPVTTPAQPYSQPATQYTPSNVVEEPVSQTQGSVDTNINEFGTEQKSPLASYLEQQTSPATPTSTPDVASSEDISGGTPTDFTFQNEPVVETQTPAAFPSDINVATSAAATTANPFQSTDSMGTGFGTQQPQQTVTSQAPSSVDLSTGMNIRYYKSDYSDLIELAKKIKDTAISRDLEYAFTMNAGVSLHFLIQPFTVLHYYANPEDVQLWRDELRLTPAQNKEDSNIGMVINTDIVFVATKDIGGFKVVEDKILLRDLTNSGEEELAAKFRQKLTTI